MMQTSLNNHEQLTNDEPTSVKNPATKRNQVCKGTVTDNKGSHCMVRCEDGDAETMTHAQVAKHAKKKMNSVKRSETMRGFARAVDNIVNEAGANVLVSGSTIFKKNNGDLKKNISLLRSS